jgi:hypothetical protein
MNALPAIAACLLLLLSGCTANPAGASSSNGMSSPPPSSSAFIQHGTATFGGDFVSVSAYTNGLGRTLNTVSGDSSFKVERHAASVAFQASWSEPGTEWSVCLGIDGVGLNASRCAQGPSPLTIQVAAPPAGVWVPLFQAAYNPTIQGGAAASVDLNWTADVRYDG